MLRIAAGFITVPLLESTAGVAIGGSGRESALDVTMLELEAILLDGDSQALTVVRDATLGILKAIIKDASRRHTAAPHPLG